MKSKDQTLLEEAYQSIYIKENEGGNGLESILPSLQWKQTTKTRMAASVCVVINMGLELLCRS